MRAGAREGTALRFQVSYPNGAAHEVELEGPVVTLGRDPTCDLVLNDPKCSRRHAVIEAIPQGMVVRDQGSANGVYVNERRMDRGPLQTGDVVRLGDVKIKVLPEEVEGTVVMEDADLDMAPAPVRTATLPPLDDLVETRDETEAPGEDGIAVAARAAAAASPPRPSAPPRPAAPPSPPAPSAPGASSTSSLPGVARPVPTPRAVVAPPPPRPAPSRPHAAAGRGPVQRPLTVSVLAALWIVSVPLYAAIGIWAAAAWSGWMAVAGPVTCALLAVLGGVMAFGLWTGQSWVRPLQIAVAALGLLTCVFTLASLAVLAYMLRRPARDYFAGAEPAEGAGDMEAAFAAGIVATVVLGVLLTAASLFFARTVRATRHAPAVAACEPVGYKRLIRHG